MNSNVLNKIKNQYHSFSKSQKLIADYILENFSQAANMTASRLAEIVFVSESTVVRFATELGYLGYPEFTDALLDYLRNESTIIKRMESISVALENQDILSTIINSDINNLKSTLNKVDRGGFNSAVDAILNAKKILLVASGEGKADAINISLKGPITPKVPASILQLHNDLIVIVDKAAASKL